MQLTASDRLWPNSPQSVERFARFVLAEARQAGVTVLLGPGISVPYPNGEAVASSGYFSADPRRPQDTTLAVALGGPWEDAFPVLVHEFAHLTQWRDQCDAWTGIFDAQGNECTDKIDAWLGGKEASAEEVKAWFKASRAVEMDAEKRAIQMIKDHQLPLDVAEYAQRANAYVLYYHHVEATRHWRGEHELPPYRHPNVWPLASSVLGDAEVLPSDLAQAYADAYGAWPQAPRPVSVLPTDSFDPEVIDPQGLWATVTFHCQTWVNDEAMDTGESHCWDISAVLARNPDLVEALELDDTGLDSNLQWGERPEVAFDRSHLDVQELSSTPKAVREWRGENLTSRLSLEFRAQAKPEVAQARRQSLAADREWRAGMAPARVEPPRRRRRPT